MRFYNVNGVQFFYAEELVSLFLFQWSPRGDKKLNLIYFSAFVASFDINLLALDLYSENDLNKIKPLQFGDIVWRLRGINTTHCRIMTKGYWMVVTWYSSSNDNLILIKQVYSFQFGMQYFKVIYLFYAVVYILYVNTLVLIVYYTQYRNQQALYLT